MKLALEKKQKLFSHTVKKTVELKSVDDEAACLKHAESRFKIVRKGTLTSKKVTASYDGKDLGKTFEDKKDCK